MGLHRRWTRSTPRVHSTPPLPNLPIDQLHENREAHCEVDVALLNVEVHPFRGQHDSDEQQERQSQRLHGAPGTNVDYANASMMPTDISTATTMTERASAMPTAVITLSKLNTKSINITWSSTAPKLAVFPWEEWSLW